MNELLELLKKSKEDIRNGRVAPIEDTCELPRLTLRLEVRASCFNHHCLAGNLTVLSGLNDVYKRYIRLIPSLYVLY